MRKKIFLLLPVVVSLSSCVLTEPQKTTNKQETPNEIIEHEYDEISSSKILWNNVFSQQEVDYFVYFYSKTCQHCASIKNWIIELALTGKYRIYFVEDSRQTVLKNNISETIGVSNIQYFFIMGFPTLTRIKNHICVENLPGTYLIQSYFEDF